MFGRRVSKNFDSQTDDWDSVSFKGEQKATNSRFELNCRFTDVGKSQLERVTVTGNRAAKSARRTVSKPTKQQSTAESELVFKLAKMLFLDSFKGPQNRRQTVDFKEAVLDFERTDAFPDSQLTAESCSLKGCQIRAIPGSVRFDRIRLLDLSQNRLSSFSFSQFPNLVSVQLSRNQLTSVRFDNEQSRLVRVDLSFNLLSSVERLPASLESADLSHNSLSDFDCSPLQSLRSLNLSFNKLRSLKGLGECLALESLSICHNELLQFEKTLELPLLRVFEFDDFSQSELETTVFCLSGVAQTTVKRAIVNLRPWSLCPGRSFEAKEIANLAIANELQRSAEQRATNRFNKFTFLRPGGYWEVIRKLGLSRRSLGWIDAMVEKCKFEAVGRLKLAKLRQLLRAKVERTRIWRAKSSAGLEALASVTRSRMRQTIDILAKAGDLRAKMGEIIQRHWRRHRKRAAERCKREQLGKELEGLPEVDFDCFHSSKAFEEFKESIFRAPELSSEAEVFRVASPKLVIKSSVDFESSLSQSNESHVAKRLKAKDEKVLEVIQEWGLRSEEARKALELKLAKERRRRQQNKRLSAAEKYEALLKVSHKGR